MSLAISRALGATERERLAELEPIIERGMASFVEVGTALLGISDQRLYRETHATFKAYVGDKWKMTWGRWSRIFDRLHHFKRTVMPEVAAVADRDKAVTEEKHCEERQRCRRMRQLCDMRPVEYDDLSATKAPCPVQFKLVANFLTDEASHYFTASASRTHGLFVYGKPRSGKTAAGWQLVANYWHNHEARPVG